MLKAAYDKCKKDGFDYCQAVEVVNYKKEVESFFKAISTAERLTSLCYCGWVRYQTMIRMAYSGEDDTLPYEKSPESIMISILLEEIPKPIFDEVLRTAEGIVADCELTGKTDSIGQIDAMMKTAIEIYYAKIDKQNERILAMEDE